MIESTTPMIPPKKVRIIFSTMNCITRVFDDAPNALRIPISEDLSIMRVILILIRFSVGKSKNNDTINESTI
jgi:hypothetical protein